MIGRIKNRWLRRVAVCLAVVPVTIMAALIGAISGGYEYAGEVIDAARKAWTKP